ncbi:MAG TPA: DMT family transporter [Rhodocyclaceae bacterium]|nr:DMT family transporter [Rhodocyclaceae bacterium]
MSANYRPGQGAAVGALLAGATVWGLIWYPYRAIEAAGLSGVLATTLTYGVALILGVALLWPKLRGVRIDGWLVAIALSAAGCNLGYVLATLHGEVMRVLLLFYLAPLWTVLLARLLLNERLHAVGAAVVGLSLAGAVVMLWHPALGAPWPRQGAEWLGLAAGMLFALSNVLIRRAHHFSIELKSMAVFAGVVAVGIVGHILLAVPALPAPDVGVSKMSAALIVVVGVVLLAINLVVQYGLTQVQANRAVVIFLFELVVAAAASWWLAGEVMGPREWLGGGLIVAASLFSARIES